MVLCVSSRKINDPTELSSYLISPLILSLITEVLQVLLERNITNTYTLSDLHPAVWVLTVFWLTFITTQQTVSLENKVLVSVDFLVPSLLFLLIAV